MLAQSPEPVARDNVLDNNPDGIGIRKCGWISDETLFQVFDMASQTINSS